jgi:hypothetical protein
MVDAMQILRKDLVSSKEKSLQILVNAGIVTPTGQLTGPYRKGA